MGILNYTTEIPVEKTIGEIEKILSTHGANAILKEYDGAGNIVSVNFRVDTEHGKISFKLPMKAQSVMQVINNQINTYKRVGKYRDKKRLVPLKFRDDLNQARRVGWRIIKDWIEAQLALIDIDMVTIQQVFLPYAVHANGQTLYEMLEENKFQNLLPPGRKER